ncbi:hypothetical protein A6R68_16533, partial [Neotoma lepida]
GSWVDLYFSNGNGSSVPASVSIYNGNMGKKLLLDASGGTYLTLDTTRYQQSRNRHHSIGEKNSTLPEEDCMERRREAESILKKNSDWIWDWSIHSYSQHKKHKCYGERGVFSSDVLKVFLSLCCRLICWPGLGIYTR